MKSRKKYQLMIIIIILLLGRMIPVFALTYPEIDSKILEIYDLTEEKVISEKDSNKISAIASLTKLATTITAIESIENLDEEVTITRTILNTVRWDASVAGLKAGDQLTYRDLLYASMLPSGADATNALAILSSGSIDHFVEKMNELASRLKLSNTHFVNVTGLDAEGHYSTASDMRTLLAYALKNELFRKIYTTREYTLSNGLKVLSTITTYNKNSSIDTSQILGSKTGYTGDAGYCLSSLSNINGHEFIIIVLNAEHKNNLYYNIVDTVELIDFLQKNFQEETVIESNQLLKNIPVKLSKIDIYEIRAKKDIKKYLPSDYEKDKIRIEYDGLEELSFQNKIGKKIGTISYYYGNEFITKETISLDTKIEISIPKVLKEYYYILIILIMIVFSIFFVMKKRKRKKKIA